MNWVPQLSNEFSICVNGLAELKIQVPIIGVSNQNKSL